ncbi:PREDICTED: uncharacterized protein LOC107351119 [Acropora digitifera]|uniref:uncharacterized protein LOC107351119 n=1 Tax=Acropora digitifera TaxID=70779 RepID=UPI00077B1178|nr:PREDICTED: uncharacterized protein LOC107351119 [Acropora digitifera]
MDKLVLVIIFSTFVALSSSFPSQESDSLENEWIEKAMKTRREELADAREIAENDMEDNELFARNEVLCPELGMLQHYDIDLKTSHIDCNPVARKRKCDDKNSSSPRIGIRDRPKSSPIWSLLQS